MDYAALLAPVIEFFSHGIGAILAKLGELLYIIAFPSNADAASVAPAAATAAATTTPAV